MGRKKVAVVGSGIAGLGSAYHLAKTGLCEVHLFEAADRLGGHSYTVDVDVDGQKIPADMGFLVYNDLTYPNLLKLFAELDVTSAESDMSFSVQVQDCAIEWNGTNTASLLKSFKNFLRPDYLRMLRDIVHFNKKAEFYLDLAHTGQWSLRHLIAHTNYSKQFYEWYLIPMGAAIWSTPYNSLLDFPAETFIRFCLNHRLLQVNGRPQWRSLIGGARDYVDKMAAVIPNIHLSTPVIGLERTPSKQLNLKTRTDNFTFDQVILASSAPVAKQIVGNVADNSTLEVLGCFRTSENEAVLHADRSLMPKRKHNWAAWNYYRNGELQKDAPVSVTYWLNTLKNYNFSTPLLATLNPVQAIDPAKTFHKVKFSHPMFDRAAISAQGTLPQIQGRGGIWFCGAWTRYGFHEDGYASALKVVERLLPQLEVSVTAPTERTLEDAVLV